MTDKAVQYYLDKDKLIDIRVDHWDNGKMYVSVYNDRNDSCVAYTCSREELRGLADFIYETIGLSKKIQFTERNKLKIPPYIFDD